MERWYSFWQEIVVKLFPSVILTRDLVFVLCWLLLGKLAMAMFLDRVMALPKMLERRFFRIPVPSGQRLRELKMSWHLISDSAVLYVIVRYRLLVLAPETFENSIVTFGIFFLWVEVWYYFIHRLMHKYDFLYKIHRSHHLSRVVEPLSSICMSPIEKWIFYTGAWLGFMAAISWVFPVTLYGIAAYYTFHAIVSVQGHSNFEHSSLMSKVVTRIWISAPSVHALHHAYYRTNYGFACTFLDRVFGTYSDPSGFLRGTALSKKGLDSFDKIKTTLN